MLLYAVVDTFAEHATARRWWEGLLSTGSSVGLVAPAVLGFVRLVTNRRLFDPPMPLEAACGEVDRWLAQPGVQALGNPSDHLPATLALIRAAGSAANLTTDAQIAAIALDRNATVASNDSDFARFAGLKVVNPLRG